MRSVGQRGLTLVRMAQNLTAEETQFYEWLFRLCDQDHDGRISASDNLFLQKSGLSGLQLDQVRQHH